jgi:hypothetical protein
MKRFISEAVKGASYESDQTLAEREIGDVRIVLSIRTDTDWYGSHGDTSYVASDRELFKGDYLYHRDSETVRKYGSDIWRDERGRICPEPEVSRYSRQCAYIRVRFADSCKYAIQDAKELEKIENGDYYTLGCFAKVEYLGREIALNSLWGNVVESVNDGHITEVLEDCLYEAMHEARRFLDSVRGVAA